MKKILSIRVVLVLVAAMMWCAAALAASSTDSAANSKSRSSGSSTSSIAENPKASTKMTRLKHSRKSRRRRYYERFYTSSYVDDVTAGDVIAGEDPVVRQAATEALGNMNGTVVAIDPTSGRVLAMVNQKLALSEGAQPCSTIKLAVALAALSEHVIDKDTEIRLGRRVRMNLTEALAHSNNAYFENVGRRLGFDKVHHYAQLYGLGEMAGWNIEGEHLGVYPTEVLDARLGGVGKMCSYGDSISITPLQLGALVSAIANGGSLYYLQHPNSPAEVAGFQPKLKRQLDIAPLVPEIADGMAGAVEYGTARSVRYNFSEEEILGKTGTCSKDGTRFGWFASYSNTQHGRIVTVVFLQGGRPTYGPKAAEIAGRMYRNLYDHSFFTETKATSSNRTPAQSAGSTQ